MDCRPHKLATILALGLLLITGLPARPAALTLSQNHQLWDQGPDILALQQFLNRDGFPVAVTGVGSPGHETDIFGSHTFRALVSFQASHLLPPTGFLGPLTRARIAALTAINAPPSTSPSSSTAASLTSAAPANTSPGFNTTPLPGFAPGQIIFGGGASANEGGGASTPDTTPPTVSLTVPSSGATVGGSAVTLTATASDNVAVANVQFKVDGTNIGSAITSSPYTTTWNSTGVADGAHTLYAVAEDASGNYATSSISVTVDNTPPVVNTTVPSSGSTVSGSGVTLTASSSDNVAVTGVQFKVDGANIGASGTTSPYSITWDSTSVVDGSHTISAVARDAAGNYATSSISISTLQGFLSTCSSVFNVSNYALQSQTFTNSAWSVANSGASNPIVTANATTAPDETNTASSVAFPAVSGASHYAVLATTAQPAQTAGFPYIADIYVTEAVGGETLWISVTPNGSAYQRTKIVATTSWQRVSVPWTPVGSAYYVQIGVDLRDGSQSAQPAQTVYVWGAQVLQDIPERPYVVSTSTAASQNVTLDCPSPAKFRDFSTLTAYSENPVIPQDAGSYNLNGDASPDIRAGNNISGTFYASTEDKDSTDWNNIAISTSTNLVSWTSYASNPVITHTPGSWDDHYLLHPSVINIGGVWYMYYSGLTSANTWGIGLATSSDFLSWHKYGTTALITSANPLTNPGLPSVVQNGSTLYMYVAYGGGTGSTIDYFTSAASDGKTWTFGGIALRADSSDWDNGNIGIEDPFVFYNKDGFWEMIYTAQISGTQQLGYAVSADGVTWYKYQVDSILSNSGSLFPGDGNLLENAGTLYLYYSWTGPTDNSNVGNLSTMVDH
jgi:predicted GH43/DUF377 family glycosyl hydrolase